ncbi:MAG TPA: phosphatase PAP2 family protein [Polyangiaceae bacterium]|nr:phosphatase PAP2 family protein [Polyangiaceae bacterium]
MTARTLGVLVFCGASALASPVRAEDGCARLAPWNRVGTSLGHFAEPAPLALAALSPLPFAALAPSGGDHASRRLVQRELGGRYALEPVSNLVPYTLAGAALVGFGASALARACEVERPLAAVLQGMAGGFLVTGVLKWGVGRQWPNGGRDPYAPDRLSHPEYATEFHPFGLLGAWPSGHTLTTFAAAAAFRAAEYELGAWRFVGYPLAAGVGLGMWFSDRHWTSDILSGALLGEAIGSSVGRSFAPSAREGATGFSAGTLVAAPLDGGMLVAWLGTW